jgi:hypothetical protein
MSEYIKVARILARFHKNEQMLMGAVSTTILAICNSIGAFEFMHTDANGVYKQDVAIYLSIVEHDAQFLHNVAQAINNSGDNTCILRKLNNDLFEFTVR